MPVIRGRILLSDGGQDVGGETSAPLRFAYVRHEPFGPTYITDVNGVIRDRNGDEGVRSLTTAADLTVYCQNSVARVLNGADIFLGSPSISARIADPGGSGNRATVTINASNARPHLDHFRVLNQVANVYQLVWRQFAPFRQAGDFPLGRSQDLEATRNRDKRIEVVFPSPVSALTGLARALGISLPDTMARVLSFTDPTGASTGWPRIYVEPDPPESRLFTGDGTFQHGTRSALTLIPSELAHALHFSLLSKTKRDRVHNEYLGWILGQLANGLPATHDIGVSTHPLVAFVETLDHFSHRLSEHQRHQLQTFPQDIPPFRRPNHMANNSTYLNFERRGINPVQRPIATTRRIVIGGRRRSVIAPARGLTLHGSLDEGAIFGALFIHLARGIGLSTVVEAVLASQALTFGEFRRWVNRRRLEISPTLDDVVQTWGL